MGVNAAPGSGRCLTPRTSAVHSREARGVSITLQPQPHNQALGRWGGRRYPFLMNPWRVFWGARTRFSGGCQCFRFASILHSLGDSCHLRCSWAMLLKFCRAEVAVVIRNCALSTLCVWIKAAESWWIEGFVLRTWRELYMKSCLVCCTKEKDFFTHFSHFSKIFWGARGPPVRQV